MKRTELLYIMNERHNSSSAFPPKIAKTNCVGQKTMADADTWWQMWEQKTCSQDEELKTSEGQAGG